MEWEKYRKDEYGKPYVKNLKGDKWISQKERNAEGVAGCLVGLIFGAISFSYYTLKDQILPFIKKALIEMYTFTRKHPKIALPIIAFFIIDAFVFDGKAVGYAESKVHQLYRMCFVHTEEEIKAEEYYENGRDTPAVEDDVKEAPAIELQITMCEYCPDIPAEDGSSMCSGCISEEEEMDGMGPDINDMGSSENSWDLYASLKEYKENIFELETNNFRIRVDFVDYFIDSDKKEYRYASWSNNQGHNEEPSLVLYSGELILMPNSKKYEFKNGLYKYTCTVINQEPVELVVYKNDQVLRRENFLR